MIRNGHRSSANQCPCTGINLLLMACREHTGLVDAPNAFDVGKVCTRSMDPFEMLSMLVINVVEDNDRSTAPVALHHPPNEWNAQEPDQQPERQREEADENNSQNNPTSQWSAVSGLIQLLNEVIGPGRRELLW